MRIRLDENLPRRLAPLLVGHQTATVPVSGWSGIKNGQLLALASREFDVFLTMEQNLEFQQNLATLPIAVLVVMAISNRMAHVSPLVPEILRELNSSRHDRCAQSVPSYSVERDASQARSPHLLRASHLVRLDCASKRLGDR